MREAFRPATTLRVLGYSFRVIEVPRDEAVDNDGTCHSGRALIRVANDLCPDKTAEVTLHEIVHAVSDAVHAELTEEQVAAFARGFYAVCRDNPEYMQQLLFG